MGFMSNLGLIRAADCNLMTSDKAHKDPDPENPDGSRGLKLAWSVSFSLTPKV